MLQSQLFQKTLKEPTRVEDAISAQLLTRADFVQKIASGVYAFLPLGWMVHQRLTSIIRSAMLDLGAQEVLLPSLQPKALWEKTGRWQGYVPRLFRLEDAHGKLYTIAPTHEEVITELVRKRISSYKDLPFALFQIHSKFRNEARAKGLLRTREFFMKDLYSFHADDKDLEKFYNRVVDIYLAIFEKTGLKAVKVEADPGAIGGGLSHEYAVLHESGEDTILVCEQCRYAVNVEKEGKPLCPHCQSGLKKTKGIEVGHTFQLGKKYSQTFAAAFIDKKGKRQPVQMGCYGIGIGRLMAAVVEVHHDEKGMCWPMTIAPYTVHLLALGVEDRVRRKSQVLYRQLQQAGISVLFDDRGVSPGEKLVEADLIGVPLRIVISARTLAKDTAELKKRRQKDSFELGIDQVIAYLTDEVGNN